MRFLYVISILLVSLFGKTILIIFQKVLTMYLYK